MDLVLKTALRAVPALAAAGLLAIGVVGLASVAGNKWLGADFFQHFADGIASSPLRRGLVILPTINGGKGDIKAGGKFLLAQMEL